MDKNEETHENFQEPFSEINEIKVKSTFKISKKTIVFVSILALLLVVILATIIFLHKSKSNSIQTDTYTNFLKSIEPEWEPLDGCSIYEGMTCTSASGDMNEKFKDNLWNTPKRGDSRWIEGFQDMNVLVGYPQLKYEPGLKSCKVIIYTKTAKDFDLTYYFNGEAQKENTKTFDTTFTGVLKVKIETETGEKLELDDIDFIWNSQPLGKTKLNTRDGQKGAIVEMFGWPDEDIEQECKFMADAGYLGVKTFPHQEQVMSYQPYENELNPWYFMYQPVSYRLQGRAGTRDQLRKMIKTCRSLGVRVYADAVVNHMSGNGNDLSNHRNPGAGCNKWGNKTSSAEPFTSPYFTPAFTYEKNPYTNRGTNALEFPGVPYGPMDFHCEKACNAWTDANNLNTGWLSGLCDLDTSKEFVRQRIADFFTDLLSIGYSGFRIDAAKHIHPTDLAAIIAKLKENMGGSLPDDFITWLEVLTGGESWLLVQGDGEYSYTGGLTKRLKEQGISDTDIEKIKIWWSGYPVEPDNDNGSISRTRKVIQNDDHDGQNQGSSSRDMHDEGCTLVKQCPPEQHRAFEVKLFKEPKGMPDNKNDAPIRLILSSYYFGDNNVMSIPDGKSDCSLCKVTCDNCKTRTYAKAFKEDAVAYEGTDYTRVHRDSEIIKAMQDWMNL